MPIDVDARSLVVLFEARKMSGLCLLFGGICQLNYVLSALIRGRGISFLPLSQSLRQSCPLSCRVLRDYCEPAVHERWLR